MSRHRLFAAVLGYVAGRAIQDDTPVSAATGGRPQNFRAPPGVGLGRSCLPQPGERNSHIFGSTSRTALFSRRLWAAPKMPDFRGGADISGIAFQDEEVR
jgi:hypothetical protein